MKNLADRVRCNNEGEAMKIINKPNKSNSRDYAQLISGIQQAEANYFESIQEMYESREKNKILLRLMHMSNPNRPAGSQRSFPITVSDWETTSAKNTRDYSSRYRRDNISAVTAYKNIAKELESEGFLVKLKIENDTTKEASYRSRTVELSVIGIKKV
jgi:hypothetical protein